MLKENLLKKGGMTCFLAAGAECLGKKYQNPALFL